MKKELQIVTTANFLSTYGNIELQLYVNIVKKLLEKYPYDMFVFEMANDGKIEPFSGCPYMQVKVSGRHLETDELLENEIVYRSESLEIKTFWFKIDDYGDKYIGTFLFPEDY